MSSVDAIFELTARNQFMHNKLAKISRREPPNYESYKLPRSNKVAIDKQKLNAVIKENMRINDRLVRT